MFICEMNVNTEICQEERRKAGNEQNLPPVSGGFRREKVGKQKIQKVENEIFTRNFSL